MKKVALVFALAVFVPSLVLAWLAWRSLHDQELRLERQQSLLYQGLADAKAQEMQAVLTACQQTFQEHVRLILAKRTPASVARGFDDLLRQAWPMAQVGFVVSLQGQILCPTSAGRPESARFWADNNLFLCNRESADVFWNNSFGQQQILAPPSESQGQVPQNPPPGTATATQSPKLEIGNEPAARRMPAAQVAKDSRPARQADFPSNSQLAMNSAQNNAASSAQNQDLVKKPAYKTQMRSVTPQQQQAGTLFNGSARNQAYEPQNAAETHPYANAPATAQNRPQPPPSTPPATETLANVPGSKLAAASGEFRDLVGEDRQGVIARFVNNKLNVLFWQRAEDDPGLIFGAQMALPQLVAELRPIVTDLDRSLNTEVCLALLDDNAKPVVLSRPGFQAVWKRPFVASEISEALPHWEVAVYQLDPARLHTLARTSRLTLGLLISVLVLTIGVGGWLIVSDLRRELTLARQKTDFVGNVSHELKTPLTSIRMFSELLAEGRVSDPAKQRAYLGIITAEAGRLTRLINNVLDFARLERGERKYKFIPCDLAAVAVETAASFRPHLESGGFRFVCEPPAGPLPVRADPDALAQVLVNLLSNAEKYSGDRREIEVRATRRTIPLPYAEIEVLDRGLGVPPGAEEKIFEKFYRAHDSLSSGIQGSGLGLTIARQIAQAHGGEVSCEAREGGGSCFRLRVPLAPE